MDRKQFTFYASYYEALEDLTEKEQAEALLAIIRYALYEEEPGKLSKAAKVAFRLARPTLDTGRRKAASGKKGGKASKVKAITDFAYGDEESKPEANCKQSASEKEKEEEKEIEVEKEVEKEVEREVEREREIEIENECYISPLSSPSDEPKTSKPEASAPAPFFSSRYAQQGTGSARVPHFTSELLCDHYSKQDMDSKISILETKLRLYDSGVWVDEEEHTWCLQELDRLKSLKSLKVGG